jgi:hypothetical protein
MVKWNAVSYVDVQTSCQPDLSRYPIEVKALAKA